MVKCKYANKNATCNFVFLDNNNICSICHCLRDIHVWMYSIWIFNLESAVKDVDDLDEKLAYKVIFDGSSNE